MSLHSLVNQAYQVLIESLDNSRIVLLHPQSRYRSMVIAKLINDANVKVYYYAMGPDDVNLQAFISGLSHDIADQHPTFGRHINLLPKEVYEQAELYLDQVLVAFIKDLQEISGQPYVLILDEYDRCDRSDHIQRFVERLSCFAPDTCRLVINSRTQPRLPWVAMVADGRAVVINDKEVIREDFYGLGKHEHNNLEVYGFGPGFVLSEGEPIDNWEGHLPRLLFFFALDRHFVTRSEICDAFWPELDTDQAVNVFHVTKRRLHMALDYDALVHGDNYYFVNNDANIYYDANDFASELMMARTSSDLNANKRSWQRVIEMYRGPFLQGHNEPWINERREAFRTGYVEALTKLAGALGEEGKPDQSLSLLQKALEQFPEREDIHRGIMQVYSDLGRRSDVEKHYKSLVKKLSASNSKPQEETASLYKSLMG